MMKGTVKNKIVKKDYVEIEKNQKEPESTRKLVKQLEKENIKRRLEKFDH
jgi:hypothetical protein